MSYVVAVRAMCEFTARRGDLDLRFTPAPTALEGIAGHGAVTSNRGARYETEIALTGTWGTLTAPNLTGGTNWPGGGADPETGVVYVYSKTVADVMSELAKEHPHLEVDGTELRDAVGLEERESTA